MDASWIISLGRTLSGGTTVWQVDNDQAVEMLNKVYKDLYQRIVSLDNNYFWDRRTSDLVEDQFEYSIAQPNAGTSTFWQYKPENIRVKYPSQDKFRDVFLTDWDALDNTPERYAEHQSKDKPFAIITDTKYVHLFPTPTDDVVWGIIFEGAKKPYDLDMDSTETDILIEPLYHEVLAYMMRYMFYEYKQLLNEAQLAEGKAEREILKALKAMWVLKNKPIRWRTKNLSHLE